MSLLRLLAAGKSLVGLKQAPARYHLSRQGALPQFATKDNPFRATVRPVLSRVPTATAVPLSTQPPATQPRPAASESKIKSAGPAEATVSFREEPAKVIERDHRAPERRRASDLKLSRLWPWTRANRSRPAAPRRAAALVQGELTLEGVKVVRNDLSDTDLEIVTQLDKPAAAEPPPERPAAPKLSASDRLGRMAGRLFGAAKP